MLDVHPAHPSANIEWRKEKKHPPKTWLKTLDVRSKYYHARIGTISTPSEAGRRAR